MLYLISGTDRVTARAELDALLKKEEGEILRITDAHAVADLNAVMEGGGMFGGKRAVVLDGVLLNPEMGTVVLTALPRLKLSPDTFFFFEEKIDTATRKQIEKYAETAQKFDLKKGKERPTVFSLVDLMRLGDKKKMWVAYQRELRTSAPEAIHGVLFWGAKQALLNACSQKDIVHWKKKVALLAELPHESRRRGVDLEYALERIVLS